MAERMMNINGNLLDANRAGLSVNNRSYKYGDGLFETIRVINGRALFLEDHFSRLVRGMDILEFEIPPHFQLSWFKKEIEKSLKANEINRGGSLRFSVFRIGEGRYTPNRSELGYVIDCNEGETNQYVLNDNGINLGVYNEIRLSNNVLSPLKTVNCLPYVMAGLYARKHKYDDVIILNDSNRISEAVSSNVFLLVGSEIYTPPLSEACTEGTMRRKVIKLSPKLGIQCKEQALDIEHLNHADEVWLTNAIQGISWVSAFDKKRYFHKKAEEFVGLLNKISAS